MQQRGSAMRGVFQDIFEDEQMQSTTTHLSEGMNEATFRPLQILLVEVVVRTTIPLGQVYSVMKKGLPLFMYWSSRTESTNVIARTEGSQANSAWCYIIYAT